MITYRRLVLTIFTTLLVPLTFNLLLIFGPDSAPTAPPSPPTVGALR